MRLRADVMAPGGSRVGFGRNQLYVSLGSSGLWEEKELVRKVTGIEERVRKSGT
jgi:hypothetical protein